MNAYPFSVFKRSNRPFYYVSYKDANGKLLSPVSTKKTGEKEAMQIAFEWLRDGIPKKNAVMTVNDLSLKDIVRKVNDGEKAKILMAELRRLGFVKSYIVNDTPEAKDFVSFLKTFWDWDTSPYTKEKLRKNHGIHKRHCSNQSGAIKLYWEPFFQERFLGEITANDIDAFINYMGDMDVSAGRKNSVIKAGTKPLRWAFSKGFIGIDPTRGHILFSEEVGKREILSPTVASLVFRADWDDARVKLANMLAAVTGMRNGEILALRFQDLGPDCIYVNGSWNRADGLKLPKNNKTRTVEIPFPDLMSGLIELVKQNPWGITPDSFVFWSVNKINVPMDGKSFVSGLREALQQIGFAKDEISKYSFHAWRHFYTSYMIKKLDRKLLKGQTGHLTDEMLTHYSDHETEGDREIIRATQIEIFAGLIPERQKLLMFKNEPQALEACG
jgi:integrase